MNEKAAESIRAYNAQALKLCAVYNGLATENVLPGIAAVLPQDDGSRRRYKALDIGCGSGRDALWLASRGYQALGVDASIEMIRNAWDSSQMASEVTFIEDQAPELRRVIVRNESYDFYLISAAWMHFDAQERQKLMSLMSGVARYGATGYISLRHGPSPADRPMFDTSVEEVKDLAADNGAHTIVLPATADQQGRGDVTWDYVAIQFSPSVKHPAFNP